MNYGNMMKELESFNSSIPSKANDENPSKDIQGR